MADKGGGHGGHPLEAQPAGAVEEAEEPSDEAGRPDLSGIAILLVEDDAATRDVTRRLLEASGANVLSVQNAEAARRAYAKKRPDAIVCDVGLPGEDGYALMESLRAAEGKKKRSRRVAAVAVTAFARAEDRERALAAGFDEHVAKPVETDRLLALVARFARAARD